MENKTKKALEFFKNKDYEKAISEFKELLTEIPNDCAILNNIGLCYLKLGQNDEAEEYFLRALSNNSKSVETYVNLSDIYYSEKRIAEAINLLETAVTLLPQNIVLLHYLARIYIEDVRYDLAIDMLSRILDISPENTDAYWDLGNIYYELGEYENAAASFEHVLEKRDNNEIFFYQTGLAYEGANITDKALSNFLKAIAVNSEFSPAYKKAAIMFLAQGDKESAKEYLEDYINFDLPEEEKQNIKSVIENISK